MSGNSHSPIIINNNNSSDDDIYDDRSVQCHAVINEADVYINDELQPGVYFRSKVKLKNPCPNRTTQTPYCEYHLATRFGLAILPSGLLPDELGLYAIRDFPADSKICPYGGKKINAKEFELEDKKGNNYILENIHNKTKTFWDAKNPTSSIARYANHGKGQCIFHSEANGKIYIVNEFPIEAGDEIFVDYGEDYWRDEQFERGSFLDSLTQPKPLHITKYKSKVKPIQEESESSDSYDDSNDIKTVQHSHTTNHNVNKQKRKYQKLF